MKDVVLDACCVINLYAAGTILQGDAPTTMENRPRRKLLRSGSAHQGPKLPLDFTLHLPSAVKQEVRYILQPDPDSAGKLVKTVIDLSPLIQAGLLPECDLEGNDELELFVHMAAKLDDGEAACFAIAKNRGWLLATDERPSEKAAKAQGVEIITTPELVKDWADKAQAGDVAVATVLLNIQTYAHYVPRKSSPLHSWWIDTVKNAKIS